VLELEAKKHVGGGGEEAPAAAATRTRRSKARE